MMWDGDLTKSTPETTGKDWPPPWRTAEIHVLWISRSFTLWWLGVDETGPRDAALAGLEVPSSSSLST